MIYCLFENITTPKGLALSPTSRKAQIEKPISYGQLVRRADHSGCATSGMNRLCSLERWARGFESHSIY
jgi:hypothetical protein